MTPYEEGMYAYYDSVLRTDNPYDSAIPADGDEDSLAAEEWDDGWCAAQEEEQEAEMPW